nr:MAG TPA_asm: hypothetical protein [Caudoviricetes sp.]DAV95223.1 MAG TPA: hypothetical protein [Caudoviricetes sp.]
MCVDLSALNKCQAVHVVILCIAKEYYSLLTGRQFHAQAVGLNLLEVGSIPTGRFWHYATITIKILLWMSPR